jgi:hypothetical protein
MAERRSRERRCSRRWSMGREHEEVSAIEGASEFDEAVVGDWGRLGLRSPRAQAQPLLQLRQRASFALVPSSSTHTGGLGPRLSVEPRAEAREVKPGPRRFAKLSKLLAMSSSSEEDCKAKMDCEASSMAVDKSCGPRKKKTGRPRKPRTAFEMAQEAAHYSAPSIWQPVQSPQGFNKSEIQSINGFIQFSYHTRFLEEIVQQLRLPPSEL